MTNKGLVHIIDDDEAVRGGLGSLIRSAGNEARLYDSPDAFMASELPAVPSCLLLDVRLPGTGTNGLDFQASLRKLGIYLPVIFVTGHGDIQMSVRGMKAGAIDFLTKPLRSQDVLDAVDAALARDRKRRTEEVAISAVRQRYETLTARERQVIALVTSGKMNKQMAGELQLSEITIKVYRGAVMKKMGAQTLADLVKMSELLRLAGPEPSSAS
jgi:FixJ family two-component response regulator